MHVTFIHGIGNKKQVEPLLAEWEFALRDGGLDLATEGVTSSMVYWADVLYPEPVGADIPESAYEALTEVADDEILWTDDLPEEERAFVEALAAQFNYDAEPPTGADDYEAALEDQDGSFERIPLPWFIKRRLMKVLLRDVHHYLFNAVSSPRPGTEYRVRDEIRRRFAAQLRQDQDALVGGPHVVVSHSMGTVIAYDCLKRVGECPGVDALVTIGSPLGLDEIQDMMRPDWTRANGYPTAKVGAGWSNVYDRFDVVSAADPAIANDYMQDSVELVADRRVDNSGAWKHDIGKYLRQPAVVGDLRSKLGL
jgi:hypothetical protein